MLRRGRGKDETTTLLTAFRKGDPKAHEGILQIVIKLREEGRTADLLKLHAALELPPPRMSVAQSSAINGIEWNFLHVPEVPSDAMDRAEQRLAALLRFHDVGTGTPAIQLTRALLRLRQGRYGEAERLCRPAQTAALPLELRQGAFGAVVMARHALGEPYEDVIAESAALDLDAMSGAREVLWMMGSDASKQILADVWEFASTQGEPAQPERTERLLAAYHKGELAAKIYAGFIGRMLSVEGRIPELLEMHARLPMPSDPQAPLLLSPTVQDLEYQVVLIPGLPAEVVDQAAARLQWGMDNRRFVGQDWTRRRAAASHTLAVARLRQRRFDGVEPLCADGMRVEIGAANRATVLATVVLARRGLGQPHEDLLAEAVSLDPDADLVAEARTS